MYHADSERAAAEVTASVANGVVWGRVVCLVVVWVCDTRTRMRRGFQTFPKHKSDRRVGSKISVFSTVWSSWKNNRKNLGLRRFFNFIKKANFCLRS